MVGPRSITRGAREAQITGHRIQKGAEKPNNGARTFFNAVNLLPKDLRFEHGGAKLVSCPGRHLTLVGPWLPPWKKRRTPMFEMQTKTRNVLKCIDSLLSLKSCSLKFQNSTVISESLSVVNIHSFISFLFCGLDIVFALEEVWNLILTERVILRLYVVVR